MNVEVFQRASANSARPQWYWQLRSANGKVMVDSGRGYDDLESCYAAVPRAKGSAIVTIHNLVTGESVAVFSAGRATPLRQP